MSRSFHHRRKKSANPDWDAMPASWRPVCEKFLHERALKFATALANGEPWAVEAEIEDGLSAVVDPGQIFEVRIFPKTPGSGVASEYFDDPAAAAAAIVASDGKVPGIYFTFNPCDPRLAHERAFNHLGEHAARTTSDNEILKRTRLLFDVDARRAPGTSATEEEHAAAHAVARNIIDGLRSRGWPEPVLADSGNGAYVIYAINLSNTPESTALIQQVLNTGGKLYDTDRAHVDLAVANASRLARVIGTINGKGDGPHRRSRFVTQPPEKLQVVSRKQLEQLAAECAPKSRAQQKTSAGVAPAEPRKSSANGRGKIPNGQRHESLVSYAGKLLKLHAGVGYEYEAFETDLLQFNREMFQEAYPEAEVQRQARDLYQRYRTPSTGSASATDTTSRADNAGQETHETKSDAPPVNGGAGDRGTADTSTPVDGAELLDDLVSYVREYVRLREDQYTVVAAWVLHCHSFPAFTRTPYLNVTSPAPDCGKTLLLEVVELVLPNPILVSDCTEASLARAIEKWRSPLLIDEFDQTLEGDKNLRTAVLKTINSGYKKSGRRLIMEPAEGGRWEPKYLSTFCPKMIAGISTLPPTTRSRCIPIDMERLSRGDSVSDKDELIIEPQAAKLKARAAAWAALHLEELRHSRPDSPSSLHNRQREVARPLFAIGDAIGGESVRSAYAMRWPGCSLAAIRPPPMTSRSNSWPTSGRHSRTTIV